MMTAAIMCGGKGSRMQGFANIEKPLLKLKGEHPCTCVMSEKRFVTDIGVNPSITVHIDSRDYCYSGISIIDSSKACRGAKIDEHYMIMNEKGVAVNVNTRSDFEIAETLMSSRI